MSAELLKRWHGRIGVLAAAFVLLLAFTGLCLNHVSGWGFDRKALRSPTLLSLYGMAEASTVLSYPLGEAYISQSNGQLFFQAEEIARCEGALVGTLTLSATSTGPIVVACEQELLLFSPTLQLIEKIGVAYGLPVALKRVGLVDGELLLDTSGGLFVADLKALRWTAKEAGLPSNSSQWSTAKQVPEALNLALAESVDSEDITYERLLLDIHSGRILGEWGVYLVDVMALLFMLLAISGVVIWVRGKKA